MRMLVSVRDVSEAHAAVVAGADFIDLKEPANGALGGLPLVEIRAICAALRQVGGGFTLSATIGDMPSTAIEEIARRVEAVAACGVDLVKVGVSGHDPAGLPLLAGLVALPAAVVPVLLADEGLDPRVVAAACSPGFASVMADTQGKVGGSLIDMLAIDVLADFVQRARGSGVQVGLAGALRPADLPSIARLAPDFVGFRSAVCDGARDGRLNPDKLRTLRTMLLDLRMGTSAQSDAPAPAQSGRMARGGRRVPV